MRSQAAHVLRLPNRFPFLGGHPHTHPLSQLALFTHRHQNGYEPIQHSYHPYSWLRRDFLSMHRLAHPLAALRYVARKSGRPGVPVPDTDVIFQVSALMRANKFAPTITPITTSSAARQPELGFPAAAVGNDGPVFPPRIGRAMRPLPALPLLPTSTLGYTKAHNPKITLPLLTHFSHTRTHLPTVGIGKSANSSPGDPGDAQCRRAGLADVVPALFRP